MTRLNVADKSHIETMHEAEEEDSCIVGQILGCSHPHKPEYTPKGIRQTLMQR